MSGWHSIVSRTGFFSSIDFLFKSKEYWRISIFDCYGGTMEAVKFFMWSSFSNMKFACSRHHFCGLNFADCCCTIPCNKHEFLFFFLKNLQGNFFLRLLHSVRQIWNREHTNSPVRMAFFNATGFWLLGHGSETWL